MRSSHFTKILLFAAVLLCLGGLAVSAQAGSLGIFRPSEGCATGECAYPDQGYCEVPADCGDIPSECTPRWTITAEGIALQRTPTRCQPLFTPYQQTQLPSGSLDSINMNFPVAYGPKVSAIRHGDCGWDVEVGYFQVDGFAAESTVPGISYMVTDLNGTGFAVTDGWAGYTSAIYSGEVNLRRQWCDGFTFLAGFRMVELNEHYSASGMGVGELATYNAVATDTFNHLYGLQIGADIEVYNMGGPLRINTLCKAGVFGNTAYQNYLRVNGGVVDAAYEANRDQASFLGEAGVVATYALTKRLAFRASAEAMWLTGVALAPEQIGAVNLRTDTAVANTSGSVFYYGGGLGLEYRF
jgi:hypothetical protein